MEGHSSSTKANISNFNETVNGYSKTIKSNIQVCQYLYYKFIKFSCALDGMLLFNITGTPIQRLGWFCEEFLIAVKCQIDNVGLLLSLVIFYEVTIKVRVTIIFGGVQQPKDVKNLSIQPLLHHTLERNVFNASHVNYSKYRQPHYPITYNV